MPINKVRENRKDGANLQNSATKLLTCFQPALRCPQKYTRCTTLPNGMTGIKGEFFLFYNLRSKA